MTAFRSHSLRDHFAAWIVDGSARRVGVKLLCPHCQVVEGAPTIAVLFANPPDGGPAAPAGSNLPGENGGRRWQLSGSALDDMSLSPSVDCGSCGHWHGFVSHGQAT